MSRIGTFIAAITLYQGATFEDVLTLENDDVSVFPLAGVTARMSVRDDSNPSPAAPYFTLTSDTDDGLAIDVESGTIARTASAARTALVPLTPSVRYELRLYYDDDTDEVLVHGPVNVIRQETVP